MFRGISGGVLPDAFFVPNKFKVCGGIENGFMSTTLDRTVALGYAASSSKAGVMFEIQMGMVDRGADCSPFSQYPHEAEILFAPLTGLEVRGTRVDGKCLVVEVRLNVNLQALTIEQVLSKRYGLVSEMASSGQVEFPYKLRALLTEESWGVVKGLVTDGVDLAARLEAMQKEMLRAPLDLHPEWYNEEANLANAISAVNRVPGLLLDGWVRAVRTNLEHPVLVASEKSAKSSSPRVHLPAPNPRKWLGVEKLPPETKRTGVRLHVPKLELWLRRLVEEDRAGNVLRELELDDAKWDQFEFDSVVKTLYLDHYIQIEWEVNHDGSYNYLYGVARKWGPHQKEKRYWYWQPVIPLGELQSLVTMRHVPLITYAKPLMKPEAEPLCCAVALLSVLGDGLKVLDLAIPLEKKTKETWAERNRRTEQASKETDDEADREQRPDLSFYPTAVLGIVSALAFNTSIIAVHLDGQRLPPAVAYAMAHSIRRNSGVLTEVTMARNFFGVDGVLAVLSAVRESRHLRRIDVSDNAVMADEPKEAMALAAATSDLAGHPTLESLCIDRGCELLVKQLRDQLTSAVESPVEPEPAAASEHRSGQQLWAKLRGRTGRASLSRLLALRGQGYHQPDLCVANVHNPTLHFLLPRLMQKKNLRNLTLGQSIDGQTNLTVTAEALNGLFQLITTSQTLDTISFGGDVNGQPLASAGLRFGPRSEGTLVDLQRLLRGEGGGIQLPFVSQEDSREFCEQPIISTRRVESDSMAFSLLEKLVLKHGRAAPSLLFTSYKYVVSYPLVLVASQLSGEEPVQSIVHVGVEAKFAHSQLPPPAARLALHLLASNKVTTSASLAAVQVSSPWFDNAAALGVLVASNTTLTSLKLRNSCIGPHATGALGAALLTNTTLKILDLQGARLCSFHDPPHAKDDDDDDSDRRSDRDEHAPGTEQLECGVVYTRGDRWMVLQSRPRSGRQICDEELQKVLSKAAYSENGTDTYSGRGTQLQRTFLCRVSTQQRLRQKVQAMAPHDFIEGKEAGVSFWLRMDPTNVIDSTGFLALAGALGSNRSLVELNLASNWLGVELAQSEALGAAIESCPSLTSLNLRENLFNASSITPLTAALRCTLPLRELLLDYTPIGCMPAAVKHVQLAAADQNSQQIDGSVLSRDGVLRIELPQALTEMGFSPSVAIALRPVALNGSHWEFIGYTRPTHGSSITHTGLAQVLSKRGYSHPEGWKERVTLPTVPYERRFGRQYTERDFVSAVLSNEKDPFGYLSASFQHLSAVERGLPEHLMPEHYIQVYPPPKPESDARRPFQRPDTPEREKTPAPRAAAYFRPAPTTVGDVKAVLATLLQMPVEKLCLSFGDALLRSDSAAIDSIGLDSGGDGRIRLELSKARLEELRLSKRMDKMEAEARRVDELEVVAVTASKLVAKACAELTSALSECDRQWRGPLASNKAQGRKKRNARFTPLEPEDHVKNRHESAEVLAKMDSPALAVLAVFTQWVERKSADAESAITWWRADGLDGEEGAEEEEDTNGDGKADGDEAGSKRKSGGKGGVKASKKAKKRAGKSSGQAASKKAGSEAVDAETVKGAGEAARHISWVERAVEAGKELSKSEEPLEKSVADAEVTDPSEDTDRFIRDCWGGKLPSALTIFLPPALHDAFGRTLVIAATEKETKPAFEDGTFVSKRVSQAVEHVMGLAMERQVLLAGGQALAEALSMRGCSLTALSLSHCSLTPEVATALTDALRLGAPLKHLNLDGNALGDDELQKLLRAAEASQRFQTLQLCSQTASSLDISCVARLLTSPMLQLLSLHEDTMSFDGGDDDEELVATLTSARRMATLLLHCHGHAYVAQFCGLGYVDERNKPHAWSGHLKMESHTIDKYPALYSKCLTHHLCLPTCRLTSLDLARPKRLVPGEKHRIPSVEFAIEVLQALQSNSTVTALNLEHNDLSADVGHTLARVLQHKGCALRVVSIGHCKLGYDGVIAVLSAALASRRLRVLDVASNLDSHDHDMGLQHDMGFQSRLTRSRYMSNEQDEDEDEDEDAARDRRQEKEKAEKARQQGERAVAAAAEKLLSESSLEWLRMDRENRFENWLHVDAQRKPTSERIRLECASIRNASVRALHAAAANLRPVGSAELKLQMSYDSEPGTSSRAQHMEAATELLRACGSRIQRFLPIGFEAREVAQLLQAFDDRADGVLELDLSDRPSEQVMTALYPEPDEEDKEYDEDAPWLSQTHPGSKRIAAPPAAEQPEQPEQPSIARLAAHVSALRLTVPEPSRGAWDRSSPMPWDALAEALSSNMALRGLHLQKRANTSGRDVHLVPLGFHFDSRYQAYTRSEPHEHAYPATFLAHPLARNNTLISLALISCRLVATCAKFLNAILSHSCLETLDLAHNALAEGGVDLADGVRRCKSLTALDLRRNWLSAEAGRACIQLLGVSSGTPLKSLNLSHNHLPLVGVEELGRLLATNTCLTELDLRLTGLRALADDGASAALRASLQRCASLQVYSGAPIESICKFGAPLSETAAQTAASASDPGNSKEFSLRTMRFVLPEVPKLCTSHCWTNRRWSRTFNANPSDVLNYEALRKEGGDLLQMEHMTTVISTPPDALCPNRSQPNVFAFELPRHGAWTAFARGLIACDVSPIPPRALMRSSDWKDRLRAVLTNKSAGFEGWLRAPEWLAWAGQSDHVFDHGYQGPEAQPEMDCTVPQGGVIPLRPGRKHAEGSRSQEPDMLDMPLAEPEIVWAQLGSQPFFPAMVIGKSVTEGRTHVRFFDGSPALRVKPPILSVMHGRQAHVLDAKVLPYAERPELRNPDQMSVDEERALRVAVKKADQTRQQGRVPRKVEAVDLRNSAGPRKEVVERRWQRLWKRRPWLFRGIPPEAYELSASDSQLLPLLGARWALSSNYLSQCVDQNQEAHLIRSRSQGFMNPHGRVVGALIAGINMRDFVGKPERVDALLKTLLEFQRFDGWGFDGNMMPFHRLEPALRQEMLTAILSFEPTQHTEKTLLSLLRELDPAVLMPHATKLIERLLNSSSVATSHRLEAIMRFAAPERWSVVADALRNSVGGREELWQAVALKVALKTLAQLDSVSRARAVEDILAALEPRVAAVEQMVEEREAVTGSSEKGAGGEEQDCGGEKDGAKESGAKERDGKEGRGAEADKDEDRTEEQVDEGLHDWAAELLVALAKPSSDLIAPHAAQLVAIMVDHASSSTRERASRVLRALDLALIADPLRETVPQVLKRLYVSTAPDASDDDDDRLILLIRSASEAPARELSTESLGVLIDVLVALGPAAPTAIAAELLMCLKDVGSSCSNKASSMSPLLRGLMHVQPAELAKHFDVEPLPSGDGRPKVGDVVIVQNKKGTIVRDDRDSRPFVVKYEDGRRSEWLRLDQVTLVKDEAEAEDTTKPIFHCELLHELLANCDHTSELAFHACSCAILLLARLESLPSHARAARKALELVTQLRLCDGPHTSPKSIKLRTPEDQTAMETVIKELTQLEARWRASEDTELWDGWIAHQMSQMVSNFRLRLRNQTYTANVGNRVVISVRK